MLALALTFLLAPLQSPAAQAAPKSPSIDLATLLVALLEKHRLPALGGAVVTADGPAAFAAIGRRSNQVPAVALSDDLWHLGSCTKAMTATLAARLVEQKKLAWDTQVGEVFSDLPGGVHAGWKGATLERLLAHRGGAPAKLEPVLWRALVTSSEPPREQRLRLVEALLATPPESAPGTAFAYSNAGYALAGAMLEARAGEVWENLMRREVFVPLKMDTAGFGAPGTAGKLDQPLGHSAPEEGKAARPQPVGPRADNPAAIAPAGAVHASLADWGRFVAAHLAGARGAGDYLSAASWTRLHTPLEGQDYALGWIVTEREWAGGTTWTHNGSNTLWHCTAWLSPARGFAVLAVTNQGGEAAQKATDDTAAALIGAWRAKHPAGSR
jgi:CubicO group peptidase (beta-lactamase class C family)